jgi:hypothetical protein
MRAEARSEAAWQLPAKGIAVVRSDLPVGEIDSAFQGMGVAAPISKAEAALMQGFLHGVGMWWRICSGTLRLILWQTCCRG